MADSSDGGWSAPTTSGTARRPRSRSSVDPDAVDGPPSAVSGWGQATNVRAGAPARQRNSFDAPPSDDLRTRSPRPGRAEQPAPDWSPAGPLSGREQRATRRAERAAQPAPASTRPSPDQLAAAARAPERGLPWWGALIVLIVVAAIGGLIDILGAFQVKGGFNIGIVVASVLAILLVKRSHMFPVVIAPPIVYSTAAVFQLYIRSSGLHDKKVVFDAAANYLVYGFPAIAAATAAVLIIAGIRMIIRK